MKTVYDALDPIVNDSISQTEKGAKYEAACRWWLSQDAYWGHELSRVGTLAQAREWEVPLTPV